MEVVTIDLAEGCDHRSTSPRDPLPDLGDVDVCVPNAAITNTIAPAHRMTRRAVAARHRREPDGRVPGRAGVPGRHARARLRAGRRDLERGGAGGTAGPGRLQRFEGGADRDGQDDRGRERGARHHRQRRPARLRRDGERAARCRPRCWSACKPACRPAGWRTPARSPRWSPTWRQSKPATSRAKRSAIDGGLSLNTRSIT